MKVGIYVFSQAINEVEAVKEASLAVSLAKGYKLTYPIFIDTESSGGRADKIDVAPEPQLSMPSARPYRVQAIRRVSMHPSPGLKRS